jgi:hypothetical protein
MVVDMNSYQAPARLLEHIMSQHFEANQEFSEAAVNKVCDEKPAAQIPHSEFVQQHLLDIGSVTDRSEFLDNAVHPIFAQTNWIAPPSVSMTEIHKQLLPALQLAAKLITDDRAGRLQSAWAWITGRIAGPMRRWLALWIALIRSV